MEDLAALKAGFGDPSVVEKDTNPLVLRGGSAMQRGRASGGAGQSNYWCTVSARVSGSLGIANFYIQHEPIYAATRGGGRNTARDPASVTRGRRTNA